LDGLWDKVNPVVDTGSFTLQVELLRIVLASEVKSLFNQLVDQRSEHNVNSLLLTWQEGSRSWEYLETLSMVFA
jgi:hypothetical protein